MVEVEFEVMTVEDAKAVFETNKVKGRLKAIIIDAPESLKITLSTEGFTLLQLAKFEGKEYYAIRKQTVDSRGDLLLPGVAEWEVSDKIKVIIEGRKNASAKFKLIFE